MEPLELRRVLDCSSLIDYAGPCMAGDANLNGQFNQTDVVQVLQAGKFLTGQPASWAEGDWTGDGVFDRLFQIDSRLLSISRWGIKAHDLDDPTTVTQQSRFGETEQSSCGV